MQLHTERTRDIVGFSIAPLCHPNNKCIPDMQSFRVNCVNSGLYKMEILIVDADSGVDYDLQFQLQCTIKPFASRKDFGHFGPGLPALAYFSILLFIWAYTLRFKQLNSMPAN